MTVKTAYSALARVRMRMKIWWFQSSRWGQQGDKGRLKTDPKVAVKSKVTREKEIAAWIESGVGLKNKRRKLEKKRNSSSTLEAGDIESGV